MTIRRYRAAFYAVIMICMLLLSGCGKRLVMTRGYGKDELFRIGNTNCTLPEYNVFLLNLQKQCERTFGSDVCDPGQHHAHGFRREPGGIRGKRIL